MSSRAGEMATTHLLPPRMQHSARYSKGSSFPATFYPVYNGTTVRGHPSDSTIPNPLFGHHPLLGQSHIVTPYIETQPGLKVGRSVTPAPCTTRGITATQLYQPLVLWYYWNVLYLKYG